MTLGTVTLGEVAAELRAVGSPDASVAYGIVTTMVTMPAGQLLAVAACSESLRDRRSGECEV